jgi:phage tail-like protein
MADRTTPYLGFNFIVALDQGSGGVGTPIGGFSDVSGLQTEITVAEYRTGNFAENHGEKYPGPYKTENVTCKRGLVNNTDILTWVEQVRTTGVAAKRPSVVITLLDESHQPVATWTLRGCWPTKWGGTTLAAKGGADVAMEELVLSVEKIEFAFV